MEAVGGCASVIHQKQGNKSIRAIHEIQEARVVTNETEIRRKENLRMPARHQSMVPPIGTEGFQGEKNRNTVLLAHWPHQTILKSVGVLEIWRDYTDLGKICNCS